MELIDRLEKVIIGTDMRTVKSYYDGSFGGVRFEKVGETKEEGNFRDVEFKGYLTSDGFTVADFQVFVGVTEENPEIVHITMVKEVAGLAWDSDVWEGIGKTVLGSIYVGDEPRFRMYYRWAMEGEESFMRVLKTMTVEFGTGVVWLESEWAE